MSWTWLVGELLLGGEERCHARWWLFRTSSLTDDGTAEGVSVGWEDLEWGGRG